MSIYGAERSVALDVWMNKTDAPSRYIIKTIEMEEFNLITPTLLFSAVSLIMLAYTNRFLSYAQLIRNLRDKYADGKMENAHITKAQIRNLALRLRLTRNMQVMGVASLLVCTLTMFFIFIGLKTVAVWAFGVALIMFIISLALSVWEITLSTKALNIYLNGIDKT